MSTPPLTHCRYCLRPCSTRVFDEVYICWRRECQGWWARNEADYRRAAVLARFRADPAKVRIRVWRHGEKWIVIFSGPNVAEAAEHYHPLKALVLAFQRAERAGMEGIDRSMGSSYEHPQKVAR